MTTRDDDHFFTEFDVNYFVTDNLRISGGYHRESEANLGVAELKYMPQWSRAPLSTSRPPISARTTTPRVTGGLRFYFGADGKKSLIRRHREDDPGITRLYFQRS